MSDELDETPDQPEQEIPEETASEQRMVPFMGDDLSAAISPKGAIYVSLPGMIAALGLNQRGQIQRIQRTKTLARGLRRISLETKGGRQRVNCLRVDKVALWLAGVTTSQIKPAFKDKIEAYQEELAPLATAVFMRVMGIESAPAADSRIAAIQEQFETLINVAMDVRAHLEALDPLPGQVDAMSWQLDQAMELLTTLAGDSAETKQEIERIKDKTAGLTAAQARAVQEMISHMVDQTAGTPGELKHATIYGRIRHRFRVNKYERIPESRFEEVMQFLRDELQRATDGESPEQGSLF